MFLLLTYDVDTTTAAGAKRLRQVSKLCERYGMRVQNSVFELLLDSAQLVKLKAQLQDTVDQGRDSIRIYRLGNSYSGKIETIGRAPTVEAGRELFF